MLTNMQIVTLRKPLTVYKKVAVRSGQWWRSSEHRRTIIEMRVPTGARIVVPVMYSSETGDRLRPLSEEYMQAYAAASIEDGKCRAERALVVARSKRSGKMQLQSCANAYTKLTFVVGKRVKPLNGFNDNATQCAAGIHCFLTRGKAQYYDI